MKNEQETFLKAQVDYFREPDPRKFHWMTANPHFSATEKELLGVLNELRPARLLEIGAGEGGNLINLQHKPAFAVGVDLYPSRCRFAKTHCTWADFVCADGVLLPFADDSFDAVFCRDLLHHVLDKTDILSEMTRVCRPGGYVVCIEASGRNPVIFALASFVSAERGLLRSNPAGIGRLLADAGLADIRTEMHQPLPIYRVLLHPRYGFPVLGTKRWYRHWNNWLDRVFARVIPRRFWGYIVASGKLPG